MRNEGLTKTLIAGGVITKHRIVKFGTSDSTVLQASAATDRLIGVSDLGAASGERCDVIMDGIAHVEYGSTVPLGALLTSDIHGRAVVATPNVGGTVRVIGVAMTDGMAGEIGSVLLRQGALSNTPSGL